jgi:protease-4
MYRDEVYQLAENEVKDGKLLYLETYLKRRTNPFKKGKPIAIVYGIGGVQRGESKHNPFTDDEVMGSDTVCAAIRAATDDKKIKVILFRVDSPGGSYVASDAILRELARARQKGKQVVVSMGNVAASGGYIVSLAADRVIAEPATITGSIGVLAFKLLTREFWANKLGITYDFAQTSPNADMFSNLHDYNPEEWAKFNAWLDRIYQEFTDKVAAGRNLPKETVLEIAKGRVWSGEDAKRLGLIDELGSFQRAVAVAKEKSGIPADENVQLVRFPKPKSIFDLLTGKKKQSSKDVLIRSLVEAIAPLRPALHTMSQMNQPAGANAVALPDMEFEEK